MSGMSEQLDCACLHNHHSADRVSIYCGKRDPLRMCGWHASLWSDSQRIRDFVTSHLHALQGPGIHV